MSLASVFRLHRQSWYTSLTCIATVVQGSPALHADIVGGSGPGEDGEGDAQVHCNTSADGGKAKCNGEANHDA